MTKQYDLPARGNGLVRRIFPAAKSPPTPVSPMQNAPNQTVTAVPVERQNIEYPFWPLRQKLYHLATVKTIPVRQPDYILSAPHAPIGAKTVEVADQRLGEWTYAFNGARASYTFGEMSAPARLQSTPGYTNFNRQTIKASGGYPQKALKAPKAARGGGGCNG